MIGLQKYRILPGKKEIDLHFVGLIPKFLSCDLVVTLALAAFKTG